MHSPALSAVAKTWEKPGTGRHEDGKRLLSHDSSLELQGAACGMELRWQKAEFNKTGE